MRSTLATFDPVPLLDALEIPPTVRILDPNSNEDDGGHVSSRTSGHMKKLCCDRQRRRCFVTLSQQFDCAHIVPQSATAETPDGSSSFWTMVLVVLGPETRNWLWATVGGKRSSSPANGILLMSSLHDSYDLGKFVLVPLSLPSPEPGPGPPDGNESAKDSEIDDYYKRYYDVEMRFIASTSSDDIGIITTKLPIDPAEQLVPDPRKPRKRKPVKQKVPRLLEDGMRFRLFTHDPLTLPLPDPRLLTVHNIFWELIGACNMADTKAAQTARKRKIRHDLSIDDDGEGDDSSDSSVASKRAKNTRHRGNEDAEDGVTGRHEGEGGGGGGDERGDSVGGNGSRHNGRGVVKRGGGGGPESIEGRHDHEKSPHYPPPTPPFTDSGSGSGSSHSNNSRHGSADEALTTATVPSLHLLPWWLPSAIANTKSHYAQGHLRPGDVVATDSARTRAAHRLLSRSKARQVQAWAEGIREDHGHAEQEQQDKDYK